MTRKQVAQRLGKSEATVRRLEGVLLHPREDEQGRYHFEAAEVEDLAARVESGDVALSRHLRAACRPLDHDGGANTAADCPVCQISQAQIAELEMTITGLRDKHDRALAAAEAEAKRQRSRYEAEHSSKLELEREFRYVVRFLETV